jgi:hypothetical protein
MRYTTLMIACAAMMCLFVFSCTSGTNGDCTPQASQWCQDGTLYWADSCDNLTEVIKECSDGCSDDSSVCAEDYVPAGDGGIKKDGGATDGGKKDAGHTDGGNKDAGHTDGGAKDGGATCTKDPCACTTADNCPKGEGCLSAESECGACRVASECRKGEACNNGVCGECTNSKSCGGLLCLNGKCTACKAPADDTRCDDEYGTGYSCQSNGSCGPDSCTGGVDCQLIGWICNASGKCESCKTSYDCLDVKKGGYAQGTLCIDGKCVKADCRSSKNCPDDTPICGTGSTCRGCKSDSECLTREGVSTGWVCDTVTGLCHGGDCFPVNTECCDASGKLRTTTYKCDSQPVATEWRCTSSACGGDAQKRDQYKYCDGKNSTCTNVNPKWDTWVTASNCTDSQLCKVQGADASCVDCTFGCNNGVCNAKCLPTDPCCTPTGDFQSSTVKCSQTPNATGARCDIAGCGSKSIPVAQYKYCSGASSECGTTNMIWEDTGGAATDCGGYCSGSAGSASCTACPYGCYSPGACYPKCTPGTGECCTGSGTFVADQTQCGSVYAQYRCNGSGCGAVRQRRQVKNTCTGSSKDCSGPATAIDNWADYDCSGDGVGVVKRGMCEGYEPNAYCTGCCSTCGCLPAAGTCRSLETFPIKSLAVDFCDTHISGGDGWASLVGEAHLLHGSSSTITWYASGDTEFNSSCQPEGSWNSYPQISGLTIGNLKETQHFSVSGSSGKSCFYRMRLTVSNYFNHTTTAYKDLQYGNTCAGNKCIGGGAGCTQFDFGWIPVGSVWNLE